MNGVHCQTSAKITDQSGMLLIQSGCGGLSEPKIPHTQVSRPLKRPYSGL